MKWSKLVANLVGNATSAIVGRPPAEVYADPLGYEVERLQVREAIAVIRRSGLRVVALPGADVRLLDLATRLPAAIARPILSRVVGGARGGKAPSLLLTAQSGAERSEVEWLNGAVARAATDLGGGRGQPAARRARRRSPHGRAAAGLVRRPSRPARSGGRRHGLRARGRIGRRILGAHGHRAGPARRTS